MSAAVAEKGALILALTGRLCKGFAWIPRAGMAHALLAEIRAVLDRLTWFCLPANLASLHMYCIFGKCAF